MNIYNYLFKFIIVGDTMVDVGKSCLLLQFTDSRFRNEHDATIGVEFGSRNLKVKDKQIKLQIWDTAGQESFRSITRSYYRGYIDIVYGRSIGGILVFDVTNRQSFENISKWYQEIQGYACDKIELVIVGNKIDLAERQTKFLIVVDRREVSYEEAKKLADKHGFSYFETSAKTGENVDSVFESMGTKILNQVEKGEIDPSQEIYGIKVGSIGIKKKKDPEGPTQIVKEQKEQSKKACC